jgi:phospholipase/carboxylesterase
MIMTPKKLYMQGSQKPDSIVLMLHGYGANGEDLISIADVWGPSLPNTLFISPNALEVCEENPFGFQWFSLRDRSHKAMLAGLRDASKEVVDLVYQVCTTYDVPLERVVLMGFSQGAMLSLYTTCYVLPGLAGVLAYSGAFFQDEDAPLLTPAPIQLIHGEEDLAVPMEGSKQAHQHLSSRGHPVDLQLLSYLEHGIDTRGLKIGQEFLDKMLVSTK